MSSHVLGVSPRMPPSLAPQFILSKLNSLWPPSLIQASPLCRPWFWCCTSTCLLPVSLETIRPPVSRILASESLLEMFPGTGLTPSHLLTSLTFHPASDRSGHVTPLISSVDTGRQLGIFVDRTPVERAVALFPSWPLRLALVSPTFVNLCGALPGLSTPCSLCLESIPSQFLTQQTLTHSSRPSSGPLTLSQAQMVAPSLTRGRRPTNASHSPDCHLDHLLSLFPTMTVNSSRKALCIILEPALGT